jgi:hypothetical protein
MTPAESMLDLDKRVIQASFTQITAKGHVPAVGGLFRAVAALNRFACHMTENIER